MGSNMISLKTYNYHVYCLDSKVDPTRISLMISIISNMTINLKNISKKIPN